MEKEMVEKMERMQIFTLASKQPIISEKANSCRSQYKVSHHVCKLVHPESVALDPLVSQQVVLQDHLTIVQPDHLTLRLLLL